MKFLVIILSISMLLSLYSVHCLSEPKDQPMKSLAMLLSISLLLSSCFSYKNLTKKEPITRDFLSKLEPEKTYKFTLNTGYTQIIKVTSVDQERVAGVQFLDKNSRVGKIASNDFSGTFEQIEKNVVKISVLKYNPYSTSAFVVFCTLSTAFAVFAISVFLGWH